jgi:PAS domain S-box-containing protein
MVCPSENEDLRTRLSEATAILDALRNGSVDALVTWPGVVSLKGADRPYRAFFEAMNEGALSLDSDGRVLHANPRFAAMAGVAAAAVQGTLLRERVVAQDWPPVADLLAGGVAGACEARLDLGHEAWLPVRISARPLAIDDQHVWCVVVTDLSDRYRAEKALKATNRNLDRRSADLAIANRELESFVYAVTHHLRAPIRAVRSFAQALALDYGDRLDETGRGYVTQIQSAGHSIGHQVNGVIELARLSRYAMLAEPVDLSALARQCLQGLAAEQPGRLVAVTVETGLTARTDRRLVEVVLDSLLSNAWKFTAGCSPASVDVYRERAMNGDWICVADNGIGFDMAHTRHLFQPFQRLHRQEEVPGVGVGLALAHRAVHRLGGRVEASGALGQGAVFKFTLGDVEDPSVEN